MAIQGLQKFLQDNVCFWVARELCNTKLVMSATDIIITIYREMCFERRCGYPRGDIHGGDMVAYAKRVRDFFERLAKCEIEPVSVCKGPADTSSGSRDAYPLFYDRAIDGFETARLISELEPGESQAKSACLEHVFMVVTNELELEFVYVPFSSHVHMARIANDLGCPILSSNSDFSILPVDGGWIHSNQFLRELPRKLASSQANEPSFCLDFKIFLQSRLFLEFPGLRTDLMPILGAMLRAPYGQTSPFDHLAFFIRRPYQARLVADKTIQRKIAKILLWLSEQENFDNAINGLYLKGISNRIIFRSAANDYMLAKRLDITDILADIYPKEDYPTGDEHPVNYIESLIKRGHLPQIILSLILQEPIVETTAVDDRQLPSSGSLRSRLMSVAIALLRPKSQTETTRCVNANATGGQTRREWKFVAYDRSVGDGVELERREITALNELEGFGSLREVHLGALIQMDAAQKRQLLLATFRCDEEIFGLLGELTASFFNDTFKLEAQYCFMLLRYCRIESEVKPMRELIEALLITLVYYDNEPATENAPRPPYRVEHATIDRLMGDNSISQEYRRTMHLVSQLSVAYWSLGAMNIILRCPMPVPQLQMYLNWPLIYKLTSKLRSRDLDIASLVLYPEAVSKIDHLESELIGQ